MATKSHAKQKSHFLLGYDLASQAEQANIFKKRQL
jgi:hypothetical protein